MTDQTLQPVVGNGDIWEAHGLSPWHQAAVQLPHQPLQRLQSLGDRACEKSWVFFLHGGSQQAHGRRVDAAVLDESCGGFSRIATRQNVMSMYHWNDTIVKSTAGLDTCEGGTWYSAESTTRRRTASAPTRGISSRRATPAFRTTCRGHCALSPRRNLFPSSMASHWCNASVDAYSRWTYQDSQIIRTSSNIAASSTFASCNWHRPTLRKTLTAGPTQRSNTPSPSTLSSYRPKMVA